MGRHSRSNSRSRSRNRNNNNSSRDNGGSNGAIGPEDAYDSEQDGYRVHIADLGIDCSQKELERHFHKFGETRELWLARNPPCFAFIVYKHKSDAEEAIKEMDGRVVASSRVRVSWARPRTRGRAPRFDSAMRCFQCGEKGHFSRDCNGSRRGGDRNGGGGGRHDDERRRRRSRSRTRSRDRKRRSHRRSHSRTRSRSVKRAAARRSRSRSQSRDKRRRHKSRSNDRHRTKRTHTRSRSNERKVETRRHNSRSRSPKVGADTNGSRIETNGSIVVPSTNGNGLHRSSRSSSKHSNHTRGDMYDPTKTDDEDEFNHKQQQEGLSTNNGDTIITGYNSEDN